MANLVPVQPEKVPLEKKCSIFTKPTLHTNDIFRSVPITENAHSSIPSSLLPTCRSASLHFGKQPKKMHTTDESCVPSLQRRNRGETVDRLLKISQRRKYDQIFKNRQGLRPYNFQILSLKLFIKYQAIEYQASSGSFNALMLYPPST